MTAYRTVALEDLIRQWRDHLRQRPADPAIDIDALESQLRGEIEVLDGTGLSTSESFLVASRRLGEPGESSGELAANCAQQLHRWLTMPAATIRDHWRELLLVAGLAVCAALAARLPALFGMPMTEDNAGFYARNASLFALPFLALYFALKRRPDMGRAGLLAVPFLAALVFANAYPFTGQSDTGMLLALHLPIALWLVIGHAHAGPQWSTVEGRMDFIRYSGELFIYYVLIALGGGVLTMFTVGLFAAIGIEVFWLASGWIIPCGAAGAVIVASWLVEARQGVMQALAPMLTRLFTPLFTLVMLAFLITMLVTGQAIDMGRDILIGFDLMLVLVLGLLLYCLSARDPGAEPGIFDVLLLVMTLSALVINLMALAAIASRISEWGFTPNRVAALGENLILMANLSGSAWLYTRFFQHRAPFTALLRWQTGYLPVYSLWAALVVILLPPLFGYA